MSKSAGGPSALELARACYRPISLYAPDRAPAEIDVSDNTNLWGVPPVALETLRGAAESVVTRYPSLYADKLRSAIASYIGVSATEVVTGCGSDDVLDSAIRAFAEPGDLIAYPDPSFAMIPIFASMNGLRSVAVPLRADHSIDADAMLATGARIVYLCSPNNPTGTRMAAEAVRRVVRESNGLVILDEAYAEFAGEGLAGEAPQLSRLLAVRTMSKAFGLAGLRIGYATGAAELVAEVEKSRGPYKVSSLAERAGLAALESDIDWVNEHIALAVELRERLSAELRSRGYAPLPSAANFVLVPVGNAAALAAHMRSLGVAVRPFSKLPLIGDALRISVGPWEILERVLAALAEAEECV
jgi:histidinol-phosphate aminotransferase